MSGCQCGSCLSQEKSLLDSEVNRIKSSLIIALRKDNEDLRQQIVYWKNKYLKLVEEMDNG